MNSPSSSQYDLDTVERYVKLQIIIINNRPLNSIRFYTPPHNSGGGGGGRGIMVSHLVFLVRPSVVRPSVRIVISGR